MTAKQYNNHKVIGKLSQKDLLWDQWLTGQGVSVCGYHARTNRICECYTSIRIKFHFIEEIRFDDRNYNLYQLAKQLKEEILYQSVILAIQSKWLSKYWSQIYPAKMNQKYSQTEKLNIDYKRNLPDIELKAKIWRQLRWKPSKKIPKVIIFEGINGTGKTTQLRLLYEQLKLYYKVYEKDPRI